MKHYLLIAVALVSLPAAAQTPSGQVRGKSCSQLVAECVAYNKRLGDDTSRCQGYKASCLATGTYQDRNRTITGVTKR